MRVPGWLTLGLVAAALGCSSPGVASSDYSQAQLNAIETREVDASFDQTFRAASNALFDAGYTIAVSDKDAGILTGTRGVDRSSERFWLSAAIRDTSFRLSIQVVSLSSKRSTVRSKLSVNGEPRVHQETIDKLWVLMQRQVLMKEPPNIDLNPGGG